MAGKQKTLPEGAFYKNLGRTIKLTRVAAGKSQSDIADHLDLTFQQVQKYESGANRIPVDCLFSLADYLEVPVTHFAGAGTRSHDETAFLSLIEKFSAKEFRALLEAWVALKDKRARAALLDLVQSMARINR